MAIYDNGTASLAANGQVTGIGTQWTMPLTLIRVGATLVFKTEPVQIYTISEITSDTSMSVYNPNGETVPAGTGYAILTHDGISVQGLAQDVAETLRYYQSRETEVADAVDEFNNFDANDFESKVTQVNSQHGDVVSIGAQVANDASQVSSDKDSAAASAASAASDKNAAAISAQEAADYAASLDTQNLLRKDLALSDLTDKSLARSNLDVYSKSDFTSESGADLIGFSYSSEYADGTIGNAIKSQRFVSASLFGISGLVDETEKLRQLHNFANENGFDVVYDVGQVIVSGKASIDVKTSVDFKGCIIKPIYSGVPSYDMTPVFKISGKPAQNITSIISQEWMRKGEMALYGSMNTYSRGTFWMDTRDPLCKRSLSDVAPNHYKTTINRITKYGGLQYPLEHDFTASPSPEAYFRPDEDFWLKVEGAHIDTSGMSSGVVFKALRSQVKFSDITIRQDDNVKMTNIRQIFYLGDGVSQIRFNDISAEAMSTYNSTSGTYLLGSNYAAEIILDNVNAVQGWGALGLHKVRDLTVTNSTLNRIDGHYHIFDIDVNHTKLHEFGVHIGVGGGYLRVTNCTKYLGTQTDLTGTSANDIDKTRRSVVYMRDDYGSYFDGDITVDNVVYKMARELTFSSASEEWPGILSCVSFNAGVSTTSSTTPDYGYTAPVPWGTTVTVKNITVEVFRDSILDSWLTFVAVNYNGNYILPAVLMPASITVEGIRYSTPPKVAKIAPVILPDLRGTVAAVASTNKRIFWNCFISIKDIQSGFVSNRASNSSNIGVQSLMCMYTQSEIAAFPTPAVVPFITVDGFYGFSGQFDVPGRLTINNSTLISCTDRSGGRNSDSFIKIQGGYVYALPNTSGGTDSRLPRAEWSGVRFINSPVEPNLTDYDACIGCTFENGTTPIGITASLAYSGSLSDSANRLQ